MFSCLGVPSFHPSKNLSQEICIEENSQAESSTQSSQATDGRSGSLTMISYVLVMVREKRSRKIAIAVDDLFCGLVAIYTWTIGGRLSIFLVGIFLRLILVPTGVFVAVFSHAGDRLSSQRNFKTCHHTCMLRFCMMDTNYTFLFSEKKSYLHMSITYTRHTAHAYRFYFFQYLSVLSERLQSILDSRWQVTRHPFRQSRNGEWNEPFKHLGSSLKAELGSCKSHQKSTNHHVKVSKIRDH